MWEVEIRIHDEVLVNLSSEEFIQFRDASPLIEARLLGCASPQGGISYCDYPRCDKVMKVYTDEVFKPELFGHPLEYTARRVDASHPAPR